MTLTAYIFPKLRSAKDLLTTLSKRRCVRRPVDRQHVKWYKKLVKSTQETFYYIFLLLRGKLTWKMSFLIYEISGHFVNTLDTDDKYCCCNG